MDKRQNIVDILKKINLFSSLNEETLQLLQEKMYLVRFNKDDIICSEGDMGDQMFIIDSGRVSVEKIGQEDTPVEITLLEPGEIAGELSLFEESVRSATLKAKEETQVWVLDRETFHKLLEQHPAFSKALLSALSRHLRRETSVVAKLLTADLDRRFKVAFFDSKPYMEEVFKQNNKYNYSIKFFESRLSLETVSLAAGVNAVCVFVNDDLNDKVIEELDAMGVKMIALRCAGYNNVNLAACERLNISVARVPAYSPYAVAEHGVALMMALNRKIHRANNRVREGNFSLNGLVGFDLHGKTVGVIGIGKIGRCMLSILAGFGCKLLAYSRTPKPDLTKELGVSFVTLDELLMQSDIISLHAPLTPETHHLINTEAIEKMKSGVMLINTGRGGLIDTNALLDGLRTGKIGYAGLDVYEEESAYFFEDFSDSIMTDDILARLTTFNNVIITSHQAFLTKEALKNIAGTTIENIREFELNKRTTQLTNHVALNA